MRNAAKNDTKKLKYANHFFLKTFVRRFSEHYIFKKCFHGSGFSGLRTQHWLSCDKSPKHFNDFIDYSLLPSFSNTLWFFWYHLIRLPAEDLSISISAKKEKEKETMINLSSCSAVHACLPSMFSAKEQKTNKKNQTVFAVLWSNSTWRCTESTGFWQFHPRSGKQKTVNKHTKAEVPDTQLAKFIASHQICDVKLS